MTVSKSLEELARIADRIHFQDSLWFNPGFLRHVSEQAFVGWKEGFAQHITKTMWLGYLDAFDGHDLEGLYNIPGVDPPELFDWWDASIVHTTSASEFKALFKKVMRSEELTKQKWLKFVLYKLWPGTDPCV